jgi:hypothetical protein
MPVDLRRRGAEMIGERDHPGSLSALKRRMLISERYFGAKKKLTC